MKHTIKKGVAIVLDIPSLHTKYFSNLEAIALYILVSDRGFVQCVIYLSNLKRKKELLNIVMHSS